VAWLAFVSAALACAPPPPASEGAPPRMYALSDSGRRVALLDPATGRTTLQVPLAATTGQLAPGPRGGVVLLPAPPLAGGGAQAIHLLTLRGARPTEQSSLSMGAVPLGSTVRDALLAADGGRHAAVVHHVAPDAYGGRCRLVVVDLDSERRLMARAVCGAIERAVGVALEETVSGPVVYASIEDAQGSAGGGSAGGGSAGGGSAGGGRIVAFSASGETLASRRLEGSPGQVALGARGAGAERRLYVVETLARPEDTEPAQPYAGRLLELVPETLETVRAHALPFAPAQMAVAADGVAYVLSHDVLHRTAATSSAPSLPAAIRLPGPVVALVVTSDRVYVAAAYEPRLWVVDRRTGRLAGFVSAHGGVSALLLAE